MDSKTPWDEGAHGHAGVPRETNPLTGDGSQSDFTCQSCGERFRDQAALGSHIQRAHSGHSCPTCGAIFETIIALGYHVDSVHPHTCPHCGEVFENEHDLDDHIGIDHHSDMYTAHPRLKWLVVPLPWVLTLVFIVFMIRYHGDAGMKAAYGVFLVLAMFLAGLLFPTDYPNHDGVDVALQVFQVLVVPFTALIALAVFAGR